MRNFISEFKEFISKGNVVDLSIGVVVGGAFGKIVSSLVSDVILPLASILVGSIKFSDIKLGPVAIGNFIESSVDFIIISFGIFILVKAINKFKKEEKKNLPEIPNQERLLMDIRDLLENSHKSSKGI